MEVRENVLKSLETARQEKFIGAPLEARVRLSVNGDLYPLLRKYAADLPALFIVSQVDLEPSADTEIQVKVERAAGQKCERCWKYTTMSVPIRVRHHLRCLRPPREGGPECPRVKPAPRALMYGLAGAVFATDRLTKWLIETRVSAFDSHTVIPVSSTLCTPK